MATVREISTTGDLPSTLDPRLAALRADVMARHGSFVTRPRPYARDIALWRAWRPGMSPVQVRAALLLQLVKDTSLTLGEGWRLAGEHVEGHGFGQADPNAPGLACLAEEDLAEADIDAVRDTFARWSTQQATAASVGEPVSDWPAFCAVYRGLGWMENHSVRDYPKVLRLGFNGILEEIDAAMASARPSDPDYARQEHFWKAARWVCEAGCLLGERYATLAVDAARDATDPEARSRFDAMAAMCRQVPARGARTLAEATQSLWLAHILTCGEDGINANSSDAWTRCCNRSTRPTGRRAVSRAKKRST